MGKKAGRKHSKRQAASKVASPLPAEKVIRDALTVAYWVDRADWLSGRKPMTPPTTAAGEHTNTKSKPRKEEGPKESRINAIARALWSPVGKPPASFSDPDIVKKVGDAYQKQYGRTVHRTTILRSRTIGRLKPKSPRR
jgi:hypothetical protein